MKAAPPDVACACRTRYPSISDRRGEHMSMANTLLGIVLVLMLSACSAPPKVPTTDERTVRQDSGEGEKPARITEAHTATTLPEPRCTKQLKQGYALRARIDNDYWQRRREGTFRDRSDDFTARWGEEAGQWADETKTLLFQIGGPTAKNRFQNAKTSIGMVSGDVRWNNIRNYLRTRLAALASICKTP